MLSIEVLGETKIKLTSLLILLMCLACTSTKSNREKVPLWVGSPYDYCKSTEEICGVGTGKTLKEADLAAKNEIASFFRLQLNSNLVSSMSSSQTEQKNVLEIQQRETFQQVISAQVDELVEGVEVIQRYILNDKEYYSLARLKKNLLEDNLRQKISSTDKERNDLLEKKARLALFNLQNLYLERQGVEKLLSMLDRPLMGDKKSTVWWDETKSMMQTPKLVKLEFDKNSDDAWEDLLSSIITQAGHKIIKTNNAKYIIKSSFTLKMEPINVEGFLKARVQWRASSFDQERGSEVIGAIDESLDVTARNKEQLWNKAKDHFKSKMLEKIHLLGI